MKKLKFIITLILLLSFVLIGFADEGITGWKYYKEIKHTDTSLCKSFFLDKEIYKHSNNDLSDIRIVNERNEFIPYYLYNRYLYDDKEYLIEYLSNKIHSHIDSKENKRYTDFKIISKDKNIDKDNFFKKVEIYGGYDNINWEFIRKDEIYRINELSKLDIQLGHVYKYTYYRIVLPYDTEDINIDSLRPIYDNKEIIYKDYEITIDADYKIESNNEEKNTIIYLNNENNLRIKDIEIISNDSFKRKYYIYFKEGNKKEFGLFDYGEIYQVDLKSFKARQTNINLDPYKGFKAYSNVIKIIINDEDNNPIDIDNIKLSYLVDKIVFKDDKSSKYKILFGNNDVDKPSYDIESYKYHIENESQELCQLLAMIEQISMEKEPLKEINYKLILNIVIVIISLLLVVIIFKRIKF